MAERTIVLDGRTVYLSKCSNANDCRCMDSAAFAIANGSTLRPADAKAKASEVADDGAVLPCGCVPPCEGHHEDVS